MARSVGRGTWVPMIALMPSLRHAASERLNLASLESVCSDVAREW